MTHYNRQQGKTRFQLITVLLAILLLFAGWFYSLKDTLSEITLLRGELAAVHGERSLLLDIRSRKNQAASELNIARKQADILNEAVPCKDDQPFVLVRLEEKLHAYPLQIEPLAVSGSDNHDYYTSAAVEIRATGCPEQLQLLLQNLESLVYISVIESVRWSRHDQVTGKLELVLRLFFLDYPDKVLKAWDID